MVAAGLDALHAAGPEMARAAQQATQTVPILTVSDDLLRNGVVTSLAHPGGNTTGVSILATELDGKRQEWLAEMAPGARHLAALADPGTTAPAQLQGLQDAAKAHGMTLSVFPAGKQADIAPAIEAAHAAGAEALNVLASAIFYVAQRQIFARTAALKLPAIYQWPEMAEAAVSPLTARVSATSTAKAPASWSESSEAPNPATCRSRSPIRSSWSSTRRPPERLASRFPKSCWRRPTRSSNSGHPQNRRNSSL